MSHNMNPKTYLLKLLKFLKELVRMVSRAEIGQKSVKETLLSSGIDKKTLNSTIKTLSQMAKKCVDLKASSKCKSEPSRRTKKEELVLKMCEDHLSEEGSQLQAVGTKTAATMKLEPAMAEKNRQSQAKTSVGGGNATGKVSTKKNKRKSGPAKKTKRATRRRDRQRRSLKKKPKSKVAKKKAVKK